jgi:CBS domain-containing protein
LNLEMKIKDLMKKDPLVVGPSESLAAVSRKMVDKAADAIRVMAIGGVDHILIVGDEGVAGTLSEADLIKALA